MYNGVMKAQTNSKPPRFKRIKMYIKKTSGGRYQLRVHGNYEYFQVFDTQAEAENTLMKIHPSYRKQFANMDPHEAFKWFLETKTNLRPNTVKSYRIYFLKIVKSKIFNKTRQLHVAGRIKDYMRYIHAMDSRQKYMNWLKVFTKFLYDMHVFGKKEPFVYQIYPNLGQFQQVQTRKQMQVLTRDEVDLIYNTGMKGRRPYLADMFLFMYQTGRRYSSIVRIKKEDYDPETRELYYTYDKALSPHAKHRSVFLSEGMGEILERQMARSPNEHIFVDEDLKPWDPMAAKMTRRRFRRYLYNAAKVKIKGSELHMLRRTSATHQLEDGRTYDQVCYWSGWSGPATLRQYYDYSEHKEERSAPENFK